MKATVKVTKEIILQSGDMIERPRSCPIHEAFLAQYGLDLYIRYSYAEDHAGMRVISLPSWVKEWQESNVILKSNRIRFSPIPIEFEVEIPVEFLPRVAHQRITLEREPVSADV